MGPFYGTIGQLDDTGRANYHGMLLSAQRRLKGGLSALSNYTLSKCMSDPATTEITGPTITDPNNPDARLLVLRLGPPARRERVGRGADADVRERHDAGDPRRLADRAARPVAERQPFVGHDRRRQRAVSGMGGQRAVQVLDDPYGDGRSTTT